MDRIGVRLEVLHDGVAGFVVGGRGLFLLVHDAALVGPAEAHLVARFFQVVLLDELLAGQRRVQGGFVDDGGQIGTAEPGRRAGQPSQIDLRPKLHLAGVDLENLQPALHIGQRHVDLPIEAARPGKGRVEHVDAVGAGDDDHLVVRIKPVHLDEDGVERLLAFVMPAGAEPRAAATADGVDFIQEDDARAVVLGLLEQVADAAGADADEHLDEVRTGDREERHVRLAGDGFGEQRLTGAGFADQQHAARDAAAEALEFLGVLQELDDLHHFVFGLFDAGHVVEGDVGVFLGRDLVAAAAEVAEHAAGAGAVAQLAEDEEVDDARRSAAMG